MGMELSPHERSALCGLMADGASDIIVKSDPHGFITAASPNLEALGVALPSLLIGPNLRDLVKPGHADALMAQHRAAFAGQAMPGWQEFPVAGMRGQRAWFEVRMRQIAGPDGNPAGVLSVLRSTTERKTLEERLFTAELTDPLTRLTNRIAFTSMLDFLVGNGANGCLALFDLDHFMTLNMHRGQAAGDDLLCAFADLLRRTARHEDIISRVGGERFALLMPDAGPDEAARLCQPVIDVMAETDDAAADPDCVLTASAGVAPIGQSVDQTMRLAETALFLAKAKGRSQVETATSDHPAVPFFRRPQRCKILAFPPRLA